MGCAMFGRNSDNDFIRKGHAAMISYLSATLVLIGLFIHVAALAPLRRLLASIPVGALRNKWLAMTMLIYIFIAGYLGYIVALWGKQTAWGDLLIPCIFLFGAMFVWMTIGLSLQTAAVLRRIEDELLRNEKLAVLGQIAGSVGHELRNPLGVMSNAVFYLETVLADADDRTREYLNIIKDEIAGSERIVSDMLDSVRTKPPHAEIVGVQELLQQTLRKLSIPPAVTVRLDIPATLPPLRVDAQQIHQVLRNLISNGIEAMPQGGTLQIGAVENKPDGTVTVSVRDSGTGIAPEVLKNLFQPLFTTKPRGIGLGLVVVKNLTQANGGTVHVASEVGKGTMFMVVLPVETGAA
jgi:signal transduction histidine kinase